MGTTEFNMTNQPPKAADIVALFEATREPFKVAASFVEANVPPSRERSLAITNLEQALMWAIAAIARNQDEILDGLQ